MMQAYLQCWSEVTSSTLCMLPGRDHLRAIVARGWGPLNYILLDHPDLQETQDRVRTIIEVYEQQVKYGVDIVDLTLINTERGAMCLTMDMFLNHMFEEKDIGKLLTSTQKKEKRRLVGLARNNGGSRVSAGLQVIIYGYVTGPECLTWARITRLERERKEIEKQAAGKLKGKVDVILSKGPAPAEGKWNNQDLKVVIRWYQRAGHMEMPKNKEGLLLRYRKTCCRIVPTYRGDDGVTDAAPGQAVATASHLNPNSTATPQKNFAVTVLHDEPAALAPALALGTESEITPTIGTAA
jgi:hypothetical protein